MFFFSNQVLGLNQSSLKSEEFFSQLLQIYRIRFGIINENIAKSTKKEIKQLLEKSNSSNDPTFKVLTLFIKSNMQYIMRDNHSSLSLLSMIPKFSQNICNYFSFFFY